jgi:hypothetical protein
MGMQLWNDWNTGLLEYERTYADGKTFDFLVMRTEDLLNPEKKFKSLIQLANFVGSPKTVEELCCLSRQAIVDMGKSSSSRGRFGGRFKAYLDRSYSDLDLKSRIQMRANGIPSQEQFKALLQRNRNSNYAVDSPMHKHHEGRSGRNAAQQRDRKTRYKHLGALLADRLSKRHRQMKGTHGHRRLTEDALLEKKPGERDLSHLSMRSSRKDTHKLKDLPFQARRAAFDRLKAMHQRSSEHGDENQSEHLSEKLKHLNELGLHVKEGVDGLHAKVDSKHAAHIGELAAMEKASSERNSNTGVEVSAGSGSTGRQTNRFRKKGENPKDVVKRYGKWVELLKDKPEVSQKLHEEGAQGLIDFGYEPARRFQDFADVSDFRCDARVQCDDVAEEAKEAEEKAH